MVHILSYTDLSNLFLKYGCKMLNTEEEYNQNISNKIYKANIESKCGHITVDANIGNFLRYKKYVYCEECIKSNKFPERKCITCNTLFKIENDNQYFCNRKCSYTKTLSEITKNKIKNSIMNYNESTKKKPREIECESFLYIKSLIDNTFIIERTNEGCLADIIIKPKKCYEDKWLLIQLKSTNISKDYSTFSIANNYKNMIICLHDMYNNNKMWLIKNESIGNITKITIGKRSVYNKYLVNPTNILEKIQEFYNEYDKYSILSSKKYAITPITDNCKKEFEYRQLRENKLNFIDFKNSEIEGQCYDFYIGKYRVQEKVGNKSKHMHVSFNLYKKKGKINIVPYYKGDNDIYWFHMPDKETFFVIPEKNLIDEGYIEDEYQKSLRHISLYYENKQNVKTKWANEYKFNYNNVDKDKLLKIIG